MRKKKIKKNPKASESADNPLFEIHLCRADHVLAMAVPGVACEPVFVKVALLPPEQ
jgi:hypothetical protein